MSTSSLSAGSPALARTRAALALLRSSIGLKAIMAVTGGAWLVFLCLHLYSNLHVFWGAEATNAYYAALKAGPAQLWGVRAMLLVTMVAHLGAAWRLTVQSRGARPQGYTQARAQATTYAARTMRVTGPIVLLYIVYHLLHLTLGVTMPAGLEHSHVDVYANIVGSFRVPAVAGAYVVATAALSLHLFHGVSSLFQSLGLQPDVARWLPRALAAAVVGALFVGQVAIPVAAVTGWLAL